MRVIGQICAAFNTPNQFVMMSRHLLLGCQRDDIYSQPITAYGGDKSCKQAVDAD